MKIPYQLGSATSKMAAEAMKPKAPSAVRRIYRFLLARGKQGATDDEIRLALGMLPSTAGARRRDLELMGACIKTTHRRMTSNGHPAAVYEVIPGVDLANKKIGRPKKDKRYNKRVGAYLLPETMEDLVILAEVEGLPVAVVVRLAIERTLDEKGLAGIAKKRKMAQIESALRILDNI